jgi:hypothetical protein
MKKNLLNEIKRNLELMNISESKVFLNESIDPAELFGLIGKLGAGAQAILNDLKTIHTDPMLFNNDSALTKVTNWMKMSNKNLSEVLGVAVEKGLIKSNELVNIIEKSGPNLTSAVEKEVIAGRDINFIKQKYQNVLDVMPNKVQDEYLSKIETRLKASVNPLKKPPVPIGGGTGHNGLPSNAGDIINEFRTNRLKYPDFPAYEVSIKKLNFSDEVEELMLVNYAENYSLSTDELIQKGMNTTAKLNEKQWGWLKKIFFNASTGKLNLMKPKAIIAVALSTVALIGGETAIELAITGRSKVLEFFGIKSAEPKPGPGPGTYTNEKPSLSSYIATQSTYYKGLSQQDKDKWSLVQDPSDPTEWVVTDPLDPVPFKVKFVNGIFTPHN